MTLNDLFTASQINLLEETQNIGAGNSITALSQILGCDADMSFPVIKGFATPINPDALQEIGNKSITVEMDIVGDLQGGLVIVVSENDALILTKLIREAKIEQQAEGVPDLSVISETSNIMAGAFMTAIHDFCGLNIFHTVPVAGWSEKQHLSDLAVNYATPSSDVILATNEFTVNAMNIKAYLLVILPPESTALLIKSIEKNGTMGLN